jgi:hypothetical protein
VTSGHLVGIGLGYLGLVLFFLLYMLFLFVGWLALGLVWGIFRVGLGLV